MRKYSAGTVTAYGAAKAGGYTGTYEEFCAALGALANVLEDLENFTVEITTLPAGEPATASYEDGVLSLGIPKGDKGDTGATGNGITSITKTGTSGLVDTYTILYTDGTSTTFTVTNGEKGEKGDTGATGATGNGIASITLTSTSGAVKTYTILYTDGTSTTFDVTDGEVTNAVLEEALNEKADIIINTASGAIANFPDGAAMPVKSLTVNIKPVQDLHGQNAPYPPKGNVNKFPNSLAATKTGNGLTISTKGDGVYTIRGTATAAGSIYFDLVDSYTIPTSIAQGGGGCLYLNNSIVSSAMSCQFYNDSTLVESWVFNAQNRISSSYSTMAGKTFNRIRIDFPVGEFNGTFAPMFTENGSTTEPFVPYSNICPITGWDAVKVTRTGNNRFDLASSNGFISQYSGLVNAKTDTGFRVTCSVASRSGSLALGVLRAGTYTASFIARTSADTAFPLTLLKNGVNQQITSDTHITFTADGTSEYALLGNFENTRDYYDVNNIQLELGSTASDFEAYNEQTVTIQLGQTVYGGTLDVLTGVLTATHGIVDLGTLNWTRQNWGGNNTYHITDYESVVSQLNMKTMSSGIVPDWLCSAYKPVSANTLYIGSDMSICQNTCIRILDTTDRNAAEFKSTMSGVQLVYELATPLTIQLTAEQLSTIKGINNIFADTGVVSVEYGADTKLYIEDSNVTPSLSMIAPIENGTTASQAYTAGQYFLHNNVFCKALTSIASGATFTLNTNYTETTVAAELYAALH